MTLADYRAQVEVHNVGGFLFLKTALKTLLKQEPQKGPGALHPTRGAIVLLTSLASEGGFIGIGNYTAAKFAVKGLVQTAGKLFTYSIQHVR
jgi:NAD(P)-dependent dehydrogenase (short-subunit alcohol dehydrogenase family)